MATKLKTDKPADQNGANGANGATGTSTPIAKPKINVFAKAATKAATLETKSNRKETVWEISPLITPDTPTRDQLNEAVTQMHTLNGERKAIETKEKVYKGVLNGYALDRYVESIAKTGVEPPSPLKVVNDKGQSVTYVVQDRGHLTKVTDDQYQQLVELIGQEGTDKVIYEAGEFKFDAVTMAQAALDGSLVQDVVAEAISEALAGLVDSGKLKQEQVDGLLTYSSERHFKPGIMGRIVEVCGRSIDRLANFLDILGSAVVRYVKV